ncbi:scamp family-domain-containing protein [Mycena floridula]|nr:scamp family-domain-containing protein [Mycena floridula]
MAAYNENPFASTNSLSLDANPFDDPPQQSASDATRLEQIRQRELDLERRETELNNKADQMRRQGRNNWPPFFPLIFHSIRDEIPEASQPLVTRLYTLWLVLIGTLLLNFVACVCLLIAHSSEGARDMGASIGYLVIIPIASFLLWYRPIYNGYMKEQALYYYLYFFFGGFHLFFSIYMILGIPSTGSAGLIQTIQMFSSHKWAVAVIGLVTTVGWTIQGLGLAFYYRQIYAHHTAAGHTMEKAKTELASHGARSYFSRG